MFMVTSLSRKYEPTEVREHSTTFPQIPDQTINQLYIYIYIHIFIYTIMSRTYQSYEHADPTQTSRGAVGGGSSTGDPGLPTGLHDTRSQYDSTKGYNPATGASYSRSSAGGPTQTRQRPLSPSPSRSDDRIVGDAPLPHTASTAQRAEMGDSRASRAGAGVGDQVKGVAASVHVS